MSLSVAASSPARAPLDFRTRLERFLVACLVVLPPLFVWFPGADSFVLPKQLLALAIVALLGATMVFGMLRGERMRLELHPVNGLAAAWWLWNGITIFWAESRSIALERWLWLTVVGVGALLLQSHWVGRRRDLARTGRLFFYAGVAMAVWVLVVDYSELMGGWLPVRGTLGDWRDRLSTAALGNTSHIADFLVFAFGIAFLRFLHVRGPKGKVVREGALLAVVTSALFVCWSVHSNLSLLVMMAVLVKPLYEMHPARWWRGRVRRIAAGFAIALAVVAFFGVPHPANPHPGGIFQEAFGSKRWKEGGETRLAIWGTGLQMVREHFLLGAGAGNFTYVYPSIEAPLVKESPTLSRYAHSWTNAAHNELIESWAESGVLGMALLIALLAAAIHRAWPRMIWESPGNSLALWACIWVLGTTALQGQMNFPLRMPVATMVFAGFLAAIPALAPKGRRVVRPLMVPVELTRCGVRMRVYMENFKVPTRAAISIDAEGGKRRAIEAGVVIATAVVLAVVVCGLAAGVEFANGKRAVEPYTRMVAMEGGAGRNARALWMKALADADPHYQRAIRLWPWLTDCRSARSELLVRAGKWQEALDELVYVRRRLDAIEVHLREAIASNALGKKDAAAEAFAVVLSRDPRYAAAMPELTALVVGKYGAGTGAGTK